LFRKSPEPHNPNAVVNPHR